MFGTGDNYKHIGIGNTGIVPKTILIHTLARVLYTECLAQWNCRTVWHRGNL
jgi:hypothetical protein